MDQLSTLLTDVTLLVEYNDLCEVRDCSWKVRMEVSSHNEVRISRLEGIGVSWYSSCAPLIMLGKRIDCETATH